MRQPVSFEVWFLVLVGLLVPALMVLHPRSDLGFVAAVSLGGLLYYLAAQAIIAVRGNRSPLGQDFVEVAERTGGHVGHGPRLVQPSLVGPVRTEQQNTVHPDGVGHFYIGWVTARALVSWVEVPTRQRARSTTLGPQVEATLQRLAPGAEIHVGGAGWVRYDRIEIHVPLPQRSTQQWLEGLPELFSRVVEDAGRRGLLRARERRRPVRGGPSSTL